MNTDTLQYLSLEDQARRLEKQSKWYETSQKWNLCGRKLDADACLMLDSAIEKGNRFRELTKQAYIDLEERKINLSQHSEILREAHKRVYGT